MKNKIKTLASAVSVAVLTAPTLALAQFDTPGGTNLPSGSIMGIVRNFMNWILILVGILGVIGFAIAGILYLTAAGDEDRIASAKKAMIYSIIGVVVALLGVVILRAVSSALGGNSTSF
jgi:hypothetical protein